MRRRQWAIDDETTARRQAELLIHRVVPWSYVELVVTINDTVKAEVNAVLDKACPGGAPPVHAVPPGSQLSTNFPHGYYYH